VLEARARRRNGGFAWYQVTATAEKDADGALRRVRGAVVDVTERREAQDAVEEALRRLEQAQRLGHMGSWEFDLVTDTLTWSTETYRLFGLDPAAFRPSFPAFLDLVHPDDRQRLSELWATSVASGAPYRMEHRVRRADGTEVWMEERAELELDEVGIAIRARGTVQDVTDRHLAREAERLAQQRDAADAANRAKSAFLAAMSHEIRTPMNAILGYQQLLELESGLTTRQRGHVDAIGRSAQHLLAIIEDVLDMSKIEAERMVLRPAPCEVHDLVETAVSLFRLRCADKGIGLSIHTDQPRPLNVVADGGRLRQIVVNLVSNAVKFTSTGSVAVHWTCVESDGRCRLLVDVVDTGRGIAPDALPQLFERFAQFEPETDTEPGTGLGLPISRGLARLMGGDITVTSTLGQGSTFHAEVDVERATSTVATASEVDIVRIADGERPRRILIAEDQADARELLAEMLRLAGFQVATVEDGHQAVEHCRSAGVDLVIMDMRMPGLDGLGAVREIRALPGLASSVPVMALTASGFEEDRLEFERAGGTAFMTKPFRRNDLLAAVGSLVGCRFEVRERPAAGRG
jgi:PAS domain S-box-containing protein